MDYVNMIVLQKLKLSDNIILNYISVQGIWQLNNINNINSSCPFYDQKTGIWEDKCMSPFTQWTENLVAVVPHEWIAYRRLCVGKYNEIWGTFIENTIG